MGQCGTWPTIVRNNLLHYTPFPLLGVTLFHGQGEELKRMFNDHGSFEMLEVQVKKKFARSREHAKSGGWVTKHWLETKEGYTKQGSQILCFQPTVSTAHACSNQ